MNARRDGRPVVSMPEIARLANVQRPVVTMWRSSRYDDFPQPVQVEAGRPLFDGREIVAWLQARGLGNSDDRTLDAELAMHSLAAHAHRVPGDTLITSVSALLCLRHLGGGQPLVTDQGGSLASQWGRIEELAGQVDPDDEFLRSEVAACDRSDLALPLLADDLAEAAFTPGNAVETLLAARHRINATALSTDAAVPSLSRLTVLLGDPANDSVVADPHAGPGDLLATAVHAIGPDASGVFLGAESDPRLARIARRRLLAHEIADWDIDVQVGRDLNTEMADPTIVVTVLPYRAALDRSPLDTLNEIERIGLLLAGSCRAVILGPADVMIGALPAYSDAERLRADLLGSGIVESITRLPGGLMPYRPGYEIAAWTLVRNPVSDAKGRVLVADIAEHELTDAVVDKLAKDVLLWRAEGLHKDGHDPRLGTIVDIQDLLSVRGSRLDPQRRRTTAYEAVRAIPEQVARISALEHELAAMVETREPLRTGFERRVGPRLPRTTLGAMIARKELRLVNGHRIAPEHVVNHGDYLLLGGPEATGRQLPGARQLDRRVRFAHYDRVQVTEPGDLVVTIKPELGVLVDAAGFNVVDYPARILRIAPDSPLTPRVLKALLHGARGTGRAPGAVRAASRLENFEFPDLPADDIGEFDHALALIEDRRDDLRRRLLAADDLLNLASLGMADGTLIIKTHPHHPVEE